MTCIYRQRWWGLIAEGRIKAASGAVGAAAAERLSGMSHTFGGLKRVFAPQNHTSGDLRRFDSGLHGCHLSGAAVLCGEGSATELPSTNSIGTYLGSSRASLEGWLVRG